MMTTATQLPGTQRTYRHGGFGSRDWVSGRTFGLIISLGVLLITMALMSDSVLTQDTFFTQSRAIAAYVLIALSQAVCLAVGDLNLSIGGVGCIATVVMGLLMAPDQGNLSPWLAVPLVLLIGPATGLLHGLIITRLKIDAFIVTLSTMFVYQGLGAGISGGNSYTIPDNFHWLGQGSIAQWVPYMLLITLGILAAVDYMYRNTVLGRRLLATGSNAEAARMSGINTGNMVIVAHVISGCLAVVAAMMYASLNGNAAPSTGDDWLLISFAVAFIGGTGLKGSLISPFGILLGAIIFRLIQHSLMLKTMINPNFAKVVLGALILLTIMVDRARAHYGTQKA
jgi:ribose transport system permease protein